MIQKQFNNKMRKINEQDFVDFTIVGNGWSLTVATLKSALAQWKDIPHGTLYGNKPNGYQSVIDSR